MIPSAHRRRRRHLIAIFAIAFPLPASAVAQGGAALTIWNNHEIPFVGAVEMPVDLPDGDYRGVGARGRVAAGVAYAYVSLGARDSVRLTPSGNRGGDGLDTPLGVSSSEHRLNLSWDRRELGNLEIALAVLPGSSGTSEAAVKSFSPLPIRWERQPGGTLRGLVNADGYSVEIAATMYSEGALDLKSRVTRTNATGGPAYLALIRRVITPASASAHLRFNGREFSGANSPSIWDRDFAYTHGVDWTSWQSGALSLVTASGFAPVPTIFHDSTWVVASHFYVRERAQQRGDTTYLISEIAGPNPDQPKKGYMSVTPYAALRQGDTVFLKWRLAIAAAPAPQWQESQFRAFAGYRTTGRDKAGATVDIGVRSVSFGTSYFPYSTLAENFDYYRTPGLSSENFWPASAPMWSRWRAFIPRMRTDLHIIRAMGFEAVRLHHLELLRKMKRDETLAFLDFYTGEARALGMHVFIDTEGPAEWVGALASRYKDVVTRVEIENEVLIPGIHPSDPQRWKSLYAAAKAAAPGAQVFLTGAGNNGMFERLRALDVPFDRVGLHAYKHGPQWKEAFSSHVLGSAGYATDIGKPFTLGEFNWKDLTRMSPELRRGEVAKIYDAVLTPHAIPEFFEFQFQESLTFNPSVAGSSSRHYEPLALDRKPKPEAFELMRVIRDYGAPDAPVRELGIAIGETDITGDRATASFTITNRTSRKLALHLNVVAYDGLIPRLDSPASLVLAPGASTAGTIALGLAGEKRVGTYHHFLEITYGVKRAYGWGVASKRGNPQFTSASILGDHVRYPQGVDILGRVNWSRPIGVAFGSDPTTLELESAYQLATTLQSATGRRVRVSSVADLPDSIAQNGTVILVGTRTSNSLVATATTVTDSLPPGVGLIRLDSRPGGQSLLLTGSDAKGVQAAVVELELRYWPNAKDATTRLTGMERGAALGNRIVGAAVDPP
ncbi:MAG: hypothetical protein H0W63_06120 [Gemmatimonadaceae bacterium]|nr:hypothetical protein [Gemmatimonadaceae bacterium]